MRLKALCLLPGGPDSTLGARIVLGLAPPRGAAAGAWASLGGVSAAGLHELPDELKPALRALVRQGWVSVDRRTNLIEADSGVLDHDRNGVTLEVGPFSIETVKLTPDLRP